MANVKLAHASNSSNLPLDSAFLLLLFLIISRNAP